MSGATVSILLVEDDPLDRQFISRALRHTPGEIALEVAEDGCEALEYLQTNARPTIIVLDLNMPRMDGKTLLKVLKNDDALKSIPTIVFSTADNEAEIAACYSLHANAYVPKPDTPAGYKRVATRMKEFWLDEARLSCSAPRPSESGPA